jgi:hypothetical protein
MSASHRASSLQPRSSNRLYLHLVPGDIAVLKFLLEANDNLAYLSTVSPYGAVVKLVFAPEQESDVMDFLKAAGEEIELDVLLRVAGEMQTRFSKL